MPESSCDGVIRFKTSLWGSSHRVLLLAALTLLHTMFKQDADAGLMLPHVPSSAIPAATRFYLSLVGPLVVHRGGLCLAILVLPCIENAPPTCCRQRRIFCKRMCLRHPSVWSMLMLPLSDSEALQAACVAERMSAANSATCLFSLPLTCC